MNESVRYLYWKKDFILSICKEPKEGKKLVSVYDLNKAQGTMEHEGFWGEIIVLKEGVYVFKNHEYTTNYERILEFTEEYSNDELKEKVFQFIEDWEENL